LVFLVVCHGFSCNEFIAFDYPTASSRRLVVELLNSLTTLKGTERKPAFVGVEEVAPSKTDENELYARWRDASDAEKPELEKKQFNEVLKHDTAVIWEKLGESDRDLAQDIASGTIEILGPSSSRNGRRNA
jgi:hypothetical protein